MKIISLTKNAVAIVDDEDYEVVNSITWYYNGRYAARKTNGKTILLHRFIMKPSIGFVIDHINGDTLDNRKCNLRICNQSQNRANSKRSKTNKSGYKGVCFDKRLKKYRAYIKKDGVMYNLGLYITAKDAGKAYNKKALELFGEFAKQKETK